MSPEWKQQRPNPLLRATIVGVARLMSVPGDVFSVKEECFSPTHILRVTSEPDAQVGGSNGTKPRIFARADSVLVRSRMPTVTDIVFARKPRFVR